MSADLSQRRCVSCEKGAAKMNLEQVLALLEQIEQWEVDQDCLVRTFRFANFHETMAFVNAVAWIAHCQDHHPEVQFGYRECTVKWWTHAVGGLTENDFICAAQVSSLLPEDGSADEG